jgi:hypothetical protein
MKKIFFTLFLLFTTLNIFATDFNWVKRFGGMNYENVTGISRDLAGNVYVSGIFRDTAFFQSHTLVCSQANTSCGFVVKLTEYGDVQWVKDFQPGVTVLDIHVSEQSVYLTGGFSGTVNFDNITLTGVSPGSNFYFLKMNGKGDVQWVKHGKSSNNMHSNKIHSSQNAIFLAGRYSNNMNFEGDTLTAHYYSGLFLIKFDAAGNKEWIMPIHTHSSADGISGIVTDENNNIYLSGRFNVVIRINNDTIPSNGWIDIFVCKLQSTGGLTWLKTFGGNRNDEPGGLGIDSLGFLYMGGEFWSDTLKFGQQVLLNSGSYDIFVAKLDQNGNAVWAKKAGGSSSDRCSSSYTDNFGNTYITGSYAFDMNIGDTVLNSVQGIDIFAAKYNSNGDLVWVRSAGSKGEERGQLITADNSGNAYVTGYFSRTTNDSVYTSTFGNHTLNPLNQGGNIFVTRIGSPLSSVKRNKNQLNVKVYPTLIQKEDFINIELPGLEGSEVIARVFDIYGREMYREKIGNEKHIVKVNNFSSGIYILRITEKDKFSSHRFVIF